MVEPGPAQSRAAGVRGNRANGAQAREEPRVDCPKMDQRAFPAGFLWGTSTSAHQVEGGNENNDWWEWEKQPGRIRDGSRSGEACRWWSGAAEEDLAAAASLGHNSHRLSVEWSRLEPEPGRWDDAAFARYGRLLAAMRRLGLSAMVTLNHITLPRWVAARGGWLARDIAPAFARFAEECIRRLGGAVDHWATINEPATVAGAGYAETFWPPALGSVRAGMRALGAMLEAHGAAYRAMKRVHPGASIGIVVSAPRFEPARRSSRVDTLICAAQDWVFLGSTLRALRTGSIFPPLLAPARSEGLRGSLDFLGVNYYGQYAVRFDPLLHDRLFGRHVQEPTIREGHCDWGQISPGGLTRQLVRLSALGVPLYVTENGIHDPADAIRPGFLVDHVAAVREAIGQGADVRGYFHWALVDNFEWAEGWLPRFGLIEVDPATQKRTPRPSAQLYARICQSNGATERRVEGGRRTF